MFNPIILWVCSLLAAFAHAQPAISETQNDVQARYEYTPHATQAGTGELTLELRDAITQQPLDYSGRRLAAWLQRQPKTLSDGEITCSDKVRALASQGIGRRAAVDFNTFSLITINNDRTVAFINPFLRLNNAKLEGIVQLPGDATAHLHKRDAHELWVAMRDSDAIAVIDTDTRALKRTITLTPGSKPQALALAGDAVWASLSGRNVWLKFSSSATQKAEEVTAGVAAAKADQLIAFDQGNRIVGLSSGGLSLLNVASAETLALPLKSVAVAATWSALSQRLIVSTAAGHLLWIDVQQAKVVQDITLGAAANTLAVFDEGRYLIAALAKKNSVAVIDVAKGEVLQTVDVVPEASEIAFSSSFAYVHSAAHGQATLLSLPDARKASVKPVNISTGTPGRYLQLSEISSKLITNTPDSMSILIANPQDGQIYQYAEGMMAPVGSFSNYKRSASALYLLNHGFESLGAGRYRATVRYTQGGAHELVLSGIQPRFANCLALALPELRDDKREALAARPQVKLLRAALAEQGDAIAVEVQLEDKKNQALAAVNDLVLLAFDKRSGWQRRVPLVEKSPGVYAAKLSANAAAPRFDLLVSSASQDMPFGGGLIGTYEGTITQEAKP